MPGHVVTSPHDRGARHLGERRPQAPPTPGGGGEAAHRNLLISRCAMVTQSRRRPGPSHHPPSGRSPNGPATKPRHPGPPGATRRSRDAHLPANQTKILNTKILKIINRSREGITHGPSP